jgi:hypothetical protein
MATLMASHTKSVFKASKTVLPGRISASHGGGMGHPTTADGFHQSFVYNSVLDVQGQLAGTLMWCTAPNPVGQPADVCDLFGLHPFSFFGNRRRTVIYALSDDSTFPLLPLNMSLMNSSLLFAIH